LSGFFVRVKKSKHSATHFPIFFQLDMKARDNAKRALARNQINQEKIMLNYTNFWKMTLSLGLLISFVLPTVGLANTRANTLPASLKLAGKNDVLVKYGQLAAKYLVDCDDLDSQPRPSGAQLKRCLTIAKELRDKFTEFIATSDTLVKNIQNNKKWTKELDEQFEKIAVKNGLDAETVRDVKQSGGFRTFYQTNINELKASKGAIDAEIKELEVQTNEKASGQNQVFQKISYEPKAKARFLKVLKKVAQIAKKVAVAIIAVCEASGGFCD
jgi:hypothetical protein